MNKRYLIAIAIIIALVAGAVWWTRGAGKRKLSECQALKEQRALMAVSGANTDDLARIDIAIQTCEATAVSLGETVDSGASVLAGCEVKRQAIAREFTAYLATSDRDAIQRNNKRQNMLHIAAEMIGCYSEAIEAAQSVATIDAVRESIKKAAVESQERARCYYFSGPGCQTFALNEDQGDTKGHQERIGVMEALVGPIASGSARDGTGGILAVANAKRDALRTEERRNAARDSSPRMAA